MSARESSRNEEGVFEPFSSDEPVWNDYGKGNRFGVRYKELGRFGGSSNLGVCMEIIEPGKQAYPQHYHMLEEEHLMVMEGELTLMLGEKRYLMKSGDYVCFPAGQKVGHAIFNHSEEPCRYLVIGETNPHDVIVFPESNRVSVRLTEEGYNKSQTMDYWEDMDLG